MSEPTDIENVVHPVVAAQYGKTDIRLLKVWRRDSQHHVQEVTLEILLSGTMNPGYIDGDNTDWMSTDTIRNRAYATAQRVLPASIEQLGIALVQELIATAPLARGVHIVARERPWSRIPNRYVGHQHSFTRQTGVRCTWVAGDADRIRIRAGVEGLDLMKTTESGWENFLQDEFTTLPETRERILATTVGATWEYSETDGVDFDACWESATDAIVGSFAGNYSPGLQHDVYRMGSAVLDAVPSVQRVELSLPNHHYLLFDLERFGIENPKEIFHRSGDPHGLIQGCVERGVDGHPRSVSPDEVVAPARRGS